MLKGKTDNIKRGKRCARFKGAQGFAIFDKEFFRIWPGRKDAFCGKILSLVNQFIKNPEAMIGHADFIDIGEGEDNPA
jgi:hypothetical protein